MKKSLALLNVLFISGILLSSYLLYTGVAPIVEGKVRVEMQDEDDIDWRFENHTIEADTYVKIINGGNYDITDVSLDVRIWENISGYGIASFSDTIRRVPKGSVYTEPIHIAVDIDRLPQELKDRLVNESTNFTVIGEISAFSVAGMGMIKVHYHNVIQWEPLLKELEIYTNDSRISYDSARSVMTISVPYFISTSSLLSGTYADIHIEILNGTRRLSETTASIPLGEDYASYLNFQISDNDTYYLMTHSEVLPIKATTVLSSGFSLSYSTEYEWGAPFDGLSMSDVYTSLNTAYVDYSFTNNYSRALSLSMDITAYDSSGNPVGYSTDSFTVEVGQYISRTASVSVSSYPSYVVVRVTENISQWTYELRRDV